jgi:hypothetical protein
MMIKTSWVTFCHGTMTWKKFHANVAADELSTDLSPTDGIPLTTTCNDTDEHPTVHQDVDFSKLEIATLELMSLCDRSGAWCGFYDELLTLLGRLRKKKIDISKERAEFIWRLHIKQGECTKAKDNCDLRLQSSLLPLHPLSLWPSPQLRIWWP